MFFSVYGLFTILLSFIQCIVKKLLNTLTSPWFKFNGFGSMVYYNGPVVRNPECEVAFRDKSHQKILVK